MNAEYLPPCNGCDECGIVHEGLELLTDLSFGPSGRALFALVGDRWLCRRCYRLSQFRQGKMLTKGPLQETREDYDRACLVLRRFEEWAKLKIRISAFGDLTGLDAYTLDGKGIELKGRKGRYTRDVLNSMGGLFCERKKVQHMKRAGGGWFIYWDDTPNGTRCYPIPYGVVAKGIRGPMDRTANPRSGINDKDDGVYVRIPEEPYFEWR